MVAPYSGGREREWSFADITRSSVGIDVCAYWPRKTGWTWMTTSPKVVNPNDFFDTEQIAQRLAGFEDRYNRLAQPFDWRFGRDDLDKFLARLERHQAA